MKNYKHLSGNRKKGLSLIFGTALVCSLVILQLSIIILYIPSTVAQAPPELFNVSYNGGGTEEAYGVAIDSNNNIIVTGRQGNDWLTIKYDSMGNELWNRTYDKDTDHAQAVAVDSNDNIIVTGESQNNYYTIKYDSSGTELWNRTYDGGAVDQAYGVAVDSNDNIIVTGFSNKGGDRDYYTIKYDSSGTELWNVTYDGGNNDDAYGVAVDSNDNIIVTGFSVLGGNHDYHTIKYNSSGAELWNVTYDSGRADDARAVAIDSLDNVIITGYSNPPGEDTNYYTIKYDSSGTELWNATYDGGTPVDEAYGIAVDSNDNIIVTGISRPPGGDRDYYTIAYNSGGNELWNTTYDGGGVDEAFSVAVDSNDCVVVTGRSFQLHSSGPNNQDFYTIKYCTDGDNDPPTTNKELGMPSCDNGNCTTMGTPIWLNATDNSNGSGVNATYYRIWNGTWHPASTSDYYGTNHNITTINGTRWYIYFLNGSIDFGPLYLNEECMHYLEYFSRDQAFNDETLQNQTHYVDDTYPVINKTIGDPNCTITDGLEYCVTTGTVITIDASDAGCCSNLTVLYRVWDGTGWSPDWSDITESLPFDVSFSEECEHWLNITAYDCLGHQVWENETFFVDNSPPSLNKVVGNPNCTIALGEEYCVTTGTEITVSATNVGCCLNTRLILQYRIWYDGSWSEWGNVTGPITFSEECLHYLEIQTRDCLGNEYLDNETFWVDSGELPPIISKVVGEPNCTDLEGRDYCVTTTTPIIINATNQGCCPNITVEYSLDGNNYTAVSVPYTLYLSGSCEQELYIRASDCWGNFAYDYETFFVSLPPTIQKSVGEPNSSVGPDEWGVLTSTPITIDASPECCPNRTVEYRIYFDGSWGSWTDITGLLPYTFYFTENCSHYLEIQAYDCLGQTDEDNETFLVGHFPNIVDPKVAVDSNGPPLELGDEICYTAWVNNTGFGDSSDNPGNEFEDPIPDHTTYVPGSLTINGGSNDDGIADGIGYDTTTVPPRIIWNGAIPAESSIEISFCVTVNNDTPPGTIISNQGTVYYDSDGDGTNDASQLTDDPGTSPSPDPTNIGLSREDGAIPAKQVPALTPLGLLGLIGIISLVGAATLRKKYT